MKQNIRMLAVALASLGLLTVTAWAEDGNNNAGAAQTAEQKCAANPQKCQEIKARRQEHCAQNPKRCEEIKARHAEHKAKCDANPEACKKKMEDMRAHRQECRENPKHCQYHNKVEAPGDGSPR